ncbi:MAG: hypothetical protein IKV15_10300 [Bacteroidaceae bacterium]|nr:hypothetical protein [Bacteroidaceae bacterium]
MKKFFRMLLLAAVALMPVMGMAQDNSERDYAWERQMRSQQYADSVKAAQQKAEFVHEQNMTQLKSSQRQSMINQLWDRDYIALFIFAGGIITIVVLYLRHSRKKAEDHKELINKLIEKDLLNSTETISKETIEALMNPNPKKSEKERYITDATILGIGIAASMICMAEHLSEGMALISFILAGIGLLRIVTRATFSYFERKNAKDNAVGEPKVEEAEIVEEK